MSNRKKEFNNWKVDRNGGISNERAWYFIDPCRLGTENWIEHMSQKVWVDMNAFIPAYIEACRRAGVTNVKISY